MFPSISLEECLSGTGVKLSDKLDLRFSDIKRKTSFYCPCDGMDLNFLEGGPSAACSEDVVTWKSQMMPQWSLGNMSHESRSVPRRSNLFGARTPGIVLGCLRNKRSKRRRGRFWNGQSKLSFLVRSQVYFTSGGEPHISQTSWMYAGNPKFLTYQYQQSFKTILLVAFWAS